MRGSAIGKLSRSDWRPRQGANLPMQAWKLPQVGIGPAGNHFAGGDATELAPLVTPQETTMKVILKLLTGAEREAEISVGHVPFLIGRADDCDLILDSPLISRRHCEISLRENRVYVRDLESRNGTAVRGRRIDGQQRLVDGDVLIVATTMFELRIRRETKIGSGINLISQAVRRCFRLNDRATQEELQRDKDSNQVPGPSNGPAIPACAGHLPTRAS